MNPNPQVPGPPDWYERATAREPARQAARETGMRQAGRSAAQAAAIAGAEAQQREWEREERAASRDPERYYGPGSPETHQSFRERATDARTQINRSRERHAEYMNYAYPGWTSPGRPAPKPEPASTPTSPGMFSGLTPQELTTLTIKMDQAAEVGEREGYDQAVTSEVHGVQADLYDARADAYYAAAGMPEPETGWWEVEAGQ